MRPRISPDGPELLLGDLFGVVPELFYELNERSEAGVDYIAENESPLLIGPFSIDTPTATPPTGYQWALRAEFTGQFVLVPDDGDSGTVTQSLSVGRTGVDPYRSLSTTRSGNQVFLAGASPPAVGSFECVTLHATCALADLPDPAAAVQTVALECSLLGPGELRYTSDAENETGGWDFTVRWVLEPASA